MKKSAGLSNVPVAVLAIVSFVLCSLLFVGSALAAVGCDLNDPDRDVARLFPESTGYRTFYNSIEKQGGQQLLRTVESRLGDTFHGIYETIDVPYTIYEIYQGKKKIGYIHGVNQKGQFGGIQVFVALDPTGKIRSVYLQKMTSQFGRKLRDPGFGKQFVGLALKDFECYDPVSCKVSGNGRLSEVTNPVPEASLDYRATVRALKKNLILMDAFVFSADRRKP